MSVVRKSRTTKINAALYGFSHSQIACRLNACIPLLGSSQKSNGHQQRLRLAFYAPSGPFQTWAYHHLYGVDGLCLCGGLSYSLPKPERLVFVDSLLGWPSSFPAPIQMPSSAG